jgi:hypothetical protein
VRSARRRFPFATQTFALTRIVAARIFCADFFGWDWSRDGRQLALVRGLWTINVLLVKDFQ